MAQNMTLSLTRFFGANFKNPSHRTSVFGRKTKILAQKILFPSIKTFPLILWENLVSGGPHTRTVVQYSGVLPSPCFSNFLARTTFVVNPCRRPKILARMLFFGDFCSNYGLRDTLQKRSVSYEFLNSR